jgi:hypothetical protein
MRLGTLVIADCISACTVTVPTVSIAGVLNLPAFPNQRCRHEIRLSSFA